MWPPFIGEYGMLISHQTQTPFLLFTPEILYMLGNVSALVHTKWYLGECAPCDTGTR